MVLGCVEALLTMVLENFEEKLFMVLGVGQGIR
jgi:hypothetical protein